MLLGLVFILNVFNSGCTTVGDARTVAYWRSDPLCDTKVMPDPNNFVRRSSTYVSNLDGSYQYSHSQGTDTYVTQTWSPYVGNQIEVRQSTYNNTSTYRSSGSYYYPTFTSGAGVIGTGIYNSNAGVSPAGRGVYR